MDEDADGAVPLSLLADLQAGLLDDETAIRLRRRARTDPRVADQLAALDRVRRGVAALGTDEASAPAIPAAVTARIGSALRRSSLAEVEPATPPGSRWRTVAAITGVGAALTAAGVGTAVLLDDGRPVPTASPALTTTTAPGVVDLADDTVRSVLDEPADLGPLAAPGRLASCLSGLGYPVSTTPLGARTLTAGGTPVVLLLLAGDMPRRITALVVGSHCSSADTGLLTSTVVNRP